MVRIHVQATILKVADQSKPFMLQTELGAFLNQKDDNGNEYPVANGSQMLLPRQLTMTL